MKPTQNDFEEADDLVAELEAMAPVEDLSHEPERLTQERKKRSRSTESERSRSIGKKRHHGQQNYFLLMSNVSKNFTLVDSVYRQKQGPEP